MQKAIEEHISYSLLEPLCCKGVDPHLTRTVSGRRLVPTGIGQHTLRGQRHPKMPEAAKHFVGRHFLISVCKRAK
jgi:hypothetical protein